MPDSNCIHVSPECPVETELYGYAPNLGANAFFTISFGLCMILHIASVIGFQMQISCLIQGPLFYSAAIYITLKHIVLNIDQQHSRLKADRYTWIFISCDSAILGIQAAGGGIAAANDNALLSLSTWVMIAIIITQIVTMIGFGYLLVEYSIHIYHHHEELTPNALALLSSLRFRCFLVSLVVSFLGIFTRCVYRLPELVGGWGGLIMKEIPYIVLEGAMICLSNFALTLCHPGWCFPAMVNIEERNKNMDGESLSPEREAGYEMVERG